MPSQYWGSLVHLRDSEIPDYCIEQLGKAGADKAQCVYSAGEKRELNVDAGQFSLFRTTANHGISLAVINSLILSIWYVLTVWKININDENDIMPTASHSFFVSLTYLAVMFMILVLTSINFLIKGSIVSTVLVLYIIFRKRGGKE